MTNLQKLKHTILARLDDIKALQTLNHNKKTPSASPSD